MTFAQPRLVRAKNQRDMRKHWQRLTKRPIDHDLLGRIGKMIGTAQHMADAHVQIVDDNAQVIGRPAIRAQQNKVLDLGVGKLHVAKNRVLECGTPTLWDSEANRSTFAVCYTLFGCFLRNVAAGIARHASFGDALRALLLKLFLAAEAVIRMAAVEETAGRSAIQLHAIGLKERPLIPIDAQPAQPDENAIDHLRSRPLEVGILNAED